MDDLRINISELFSPPGHHTQKLTMILYEAQTTGKVDMSALLSAGCLVVSSHTEPTDESAVTIVPGTRPPVPALYSEE